METKQGTAAGSAAATTKRSRSIAGKKMSPQQQQFFKVIKMPSSELGAAIKTATERIALHIDNATDHDAKAKKERDDAQREFEENIAYYYEAKQRLLNPGYRTDVDGGKERTPGENEKNFGAPNWAALREKCVAYSLQHADRMLKAFAKANGLLTDEGGNIDDPEPEDHEGAARPQPRRTEDPTAQRRYEFIATAAMDIASRNPEGEVEKQILAAAEYEPAPLMLVSPDLFTELLSFVTQISTSSADEGVRAEAMQLINKMRLHKPAPQVAAVPPVVAEEEKRKRDKRLAKKNGQPLGTSGTPEHVQRLEPTPSGTSGDSGSGAIPAQDLQTDHQAGLEAPISSPVAEPPIAGAAGVKQPNAAETRGGEPILPGDWVTTDRTCKYLGRFQGKKGKRFILAWYDKPSKEWCSNPKLTDGVHRCLTEEQVREKFPGALEAWGASQAATAEPALRPSSNAVPGGAAASATDLSAGEAPNGSTVESASASGMDEAGQDRNAQPDQLHPSSPMDAVPQDAGPLGVANQDAPQAAAAPAPRRGRGEKARKPISSPKVTVCPPALSPEEEERIHERLIASANHPGRRQGACVLNEKGKWEYAPEEQNLPPAKVTATDPTPFRVKKRIQGEIINFAVIRDGDKLPEEVFNGESEAKAFCENLNKPPVASLVPQHTNPQFAAQSAGY